MEFLAGLQPGEDDRDGVVAGETDHLTGEVDDPDGFAHVQDEKVAAGSERSGLEHQPRGFGDGHEIAGHCWMCDGDRPARANLLTEDRYDAAVRTEYIAEADGDQSRVGSTRPRLHVKLTQALAHAHDARGPYGLVGRDEDERLNTGVNHLVDENARADDIVFDGLTRVRFHHSDMFMRGCMKHDVRLVRGKHRAQLRGVGDARDAVNDLTSRARCAARGPGKRGRFLRCRAESTDEDGWR